MTCKHKDIIFDGISHICNGCGEVLSEDRFVDDAPRVYGEEGGDRKQHETLDRFSVRRTVIKVGPGKMENGFKETFRRISKSDRWSNYMPEKKAQSVKVSIVNFLTNNGLVSKNILKTAQYYILKTKTINLQGNSLECYTAALLVYTFRECKIPFGVKKLINYFNVRSSSVFKLLGKLIKKYKLVNIPPLKLQDYVKYYVNKIGTIYGFDSKKLIQLQRKCLNCAEKMGIYNACGSNKLCDAAGIIYYISKKDKLGITQEVISDILSISSVSLRNAHKKIKLVDNNKNK
jgi:transcription initiation factor TFIIIB Brf1 subunit/transcription initiation factor TFIIB